MSDVSMLAGLRLPIESEILEQAALEPHMFPERSLVTQEYILASQTYRFFFGQFMVGKTGLNRLDQRIIEKDYKQRTEEDFYSRYDTLGLKYFILRSMARVERLSEEERACFLKKDMSKEDVARCFRIVQETYRKVMCISPDQMDVIFEDQPTLYRDYAFRGGNLILEARCSADFDENGMIVDRAEEDKRINVFEGFKRQLEPMLTEEMGMGVTLVLNII